MRKALNAYISIFFSQGCTVLHCQYSTGQFIPESCLFFHPVLWAEPSLIGSNTGQELLQLQLLLIPILRCTDTVMSAIQEPRHRKHTMWKKIRLS